MLPNVGTWELIIIILVVFLVFGSKRLPEIAGGIGRGIRAFRRELQGINEEIQRSVEPPSSGNARRTPEPYRANPSTPAATEHADGQSARDKGEQPTRTPKQSDDDGPAML